LNFPIRKHSLPINSSLQANLDWTNLFEQAETVGCKRIVLLGLSLAAQFFATPIPVATSEILKSDRSVQQLSAEIAARLIQPTLMVCLPPHSRHSIKNAELPTWVGSCL
jgi:hypothetical protein